jgi:hypothetical protein
MAISAGLAWSLANGISQEQYDQKLIDAYTAAQSKGLTDAQIESNMNQYGVSAADVSRALRVPIGDVQTRLEAATPTTTTEISYNKAAMDELAAREAQWAKQQEVNATNWAAQQQTNATNWAAQQKANELAWAEQQRLNALKNAEQQRLNQLASQQQITANEKAYQDYLASQANKATGFQTSAGTLPFANATQGFAQNFQNYQSIAPGAQYNPAVMAGGASPYSLIRGQMQPMGNPYAGVVAGQAMGGYNPGLYDQIAAANLERDIAAKSGVTLADYYSAGDSGGDGGDGGGGGGDGGGTGAGAGTGNAMAKGGYVHGGLMFGANPPGPDDGAVNLDIGEYVIKKSSVNKYGRGLLDMINEGKVSAKKMKSLLG